MPVADGASYFETIRMEILVHQLQRLGDMIPIGDNDLRVVLHHRDNDRLCIQQGVDILPVNDHFYIQETKQGLVPPGNNDMVRSID